MVLLDLLGKYRVQWGHFCFLSLSVINRNILESCVVELLTILSYLYQRCINPDPQDFCQKGSNLFLKSIHFSFCGSGSFKKISSFKCDG